MAAKTAKKRAAPKPPKPPRVPPWEDGDKVVLTVKGHALSGLYCAGGWSWECPEWPGLARDHDGDKEPAGMCGDFTLKVRLESIRSRQAQQQELGASQ